MSDVVSAPIPGRLYDIGPTGEPVPARVVTLPDGAPAATCPGGDGGRGGGGDHDRLSVRGARGGPHSLAVPRRHHPQGGPMTNIPTRAGERYLCFVIEREDRGWGGPYGQHRRPLIWRCTECGHTISDHTDTFTGPKRRDSWAMARLAEHHECGHAPCSYCGQMLLRRKDGTPRQHAANRCPGKDPGFIIEREFARNIERREYE